jgi:DNA-directed RNA polymerase specialized sigma24 family protein
MIAASEDILMDLLRRAGRGDETALRELQQLTRRLLAYCIRRVVKDPRREEEVLQDVYTYIWQHTGEYRKERGTPWAWFYTLARSRAIDSIRRTRREPLAVELDDNVRPVVRVDQFVCPFSQPAAHSSVRAVIKAAIQKEKSP